ncbi:hypothetical protein FA15DRAFT_662588 [Coprinopsis marcescibilis]|uniref:Uncharacterized protein n=1 Tax=Coprinopsis marcescibilis TaxID=230819 RepID=A0A5C3LCT7_COPMA|nr:hypothetical protein FA15DRAFT_662588 [Coprinopsis marcescibilis]
MSEIDDIFASKAKARPSTNPSVPKVKDTEQSKPSKKKRKKKPASDAEQKPEEPVPSPPKKRPIPETIVDPSSQFPSAKRHKSDSKSKNEPKVKESKPKAKEEEDRFVDSRGTGSRRTTEEGWSVYKEDELGISHEGGGKPTAAHFFLLFTFLSPQTLRCVRLIVTAVFELYITILDQSMTSVSFLNPLILISPGSFEASRTVLGLWSLEVKKEPT